MIIDIKVPSPGESITQVQLANWLVKNGDQVEKDDEIAEIDSDKATLSISAEETGKIEILVQEGATVDIGTVVAQIDTSAQGQKPTSPQPHTENTTVKEPIAQAEKEEPTIEPSEEPDPTIHISPLAKKIMDQQQLSKKAVLAQFGSLRLGREDLHLTAEEPTIGSTGQTPTSGWKGTRKTDRKKMSTLRLKLSQRLVSVKNETAMLTTFNEVNMQAIFEIRKQYKASFKEKHGIGLGFMSFFTKAVTIALHHFPQVNAILDNQELIYHDYADIGIAVSGPKGLVVPVLRNAEQMSLATIEKTIKELAEKARNNKITLDEMTGGTFTITNGGVFGSMLSTPILNPPQSAILGMHNIIERPIAVNGKVEIHPMMYVALSYDHRVIDGRESVTFLMKIKELLENPAQLLLDGQNPIKSLLDL